MKAGSAEDKKHICKQVKKQCKQDWIDWAELSISNELDLRDKWLGIRNMKTKRAPQVFERNNRHGKPVSLGLQAEATADYLEQDQWAPISQTYNGLHTIEAPPNLSPPTRFISDPSGFNLQDFTLRELRNYLKRCKNHKTPGPDELQMELFKWLDDENLELVRAILNQWWRGETIPHEVLQARVASIYKKGDPRNPGNYRPISLLNSIYKIYAALLQTRISATLDTLIQKTQFGFRKGKSTTNALICIRRVLEVAEATQQKVFLTFLDWEKAFDKVRQDRLLQSLERIGCPAQVCKAIANLYSSPQFMVQIKEHCSQWKTQDRGIRQGCPLSPYLFIVVMSIMFDDIHSTSNHTRGRLPHLDFTEILYADDTVLITDNAHAMNRLLKDVEEHASYMGLAFNSESVQR